jgi:hypothetical protein
MARQRDRRGVHLALASSRRRRCVVECEGMRVSVRIVAASSRQGRMDTSVEVAWPPRWRLAIRKGEIALIDDAGQSGPQARRRNVGGGCSVDADDPPREVAAGLYRHRSDK